MVRPGQTAITFPCLRFDLDLSSCVCSFRRYSNVIDSTGLHPRPASPKSLQTHFPKTPLCQTYGSTVYASKRGESLSELLARAELVSGAPACLGGIKRRLPDDPRLIRILCGMGRSSLQMSLSTG